MRALCLALGCACVIAGCSQGATKGSSFEQGENYQTPNKKKTPSSIGEIEEEDAGPADAATERAIYSATLDPLTPPSAHVYALAKEPTPDGALVMEGKTSNLPRTALTLEVTKNGALYDVDLVWKRNDGAEPALSWTVKARLSLEKQ
jgi:hypothetical protein